MIIDKSGLSKLTASKIELLELRNECLQDLINKNNLEILDLLDPHSKKIETEQEKVYRTGRY